MFVFNSVLKLRVENLMAWMDAEKILDHYLAGRSRNTFPTYEMAFRKLWVHGNEIGKLVFGGII